MVVVIHVAAAMVVEEKVEVVRYVPVYINVLVVVVVALAEPKK